LTGSESRGGRSAHGGEEDGSREEHLE
jgi:hypothetical protein